MPHRVCKSHSSRTSRGHHQVFPHYGKMPYISSTENATTAARELTHALQNPTPASPLSNIGDKQMEALNQPPKRFQQAVTKSDNTPNSVAPPNIMQTRQVPQPQIQTAPQKHDTHPHCPNIIKDNNANQPQKLAHEDQPLGLGIPPQRNSLTPHHIAIDYATSPRVKPSPRVEELPRYQMQSRTRQQKFISTKYADAENYIAIAGANSITHPITNQAQEYRHLIRGDEK